MSQAERLLILLLRVVGVVCCFAVFAVFMPRAWMAAIHEWLGVGEFPQGPIVEYLARSLSAFYALLGGLMLLISRDTRRHATVVTYLALGGMLFGILIFAIDLAIGMPRHWAFGEGPFVFLCSAAILMLQAKARLGQQDGQGAETPG
jgi:hypothetical protein